MLLQRVLGFLPLIIYADVFLQLHLDDIWHSTVQIHNLDCQSLIHLQVYL
jgi:hypothetical protein